MADYRFSFHEKGKEYNPASIAPEGKIIFFIAKNLFIWQEFGEFRQPNAILF